MLQEVLELQGHQVLLQELPVCGLAGASRQVPNARGAPQAQRDAVECLFWEGKEGYLRMVNALIDRGADVNAPSTKAEFKKLTPLMAASGHGRVEVMRVLLAACAQIDQVCANGGTALMTASMNGQVEAIRVLLAAGAQVNQVDAIGFSALMVASAEGFVHAVKVLLGAGADPRITSPDGDTALGFAQLKRHPAVVSLLQAKLAELAGSA